MAGNLFQHSEIQPEEPSDEQGGGLTQQWQELSAPPRQNKPRVNVPVYFAPPSPRYVVVQMPYVPPNPFSVAPSPTDVAPPPGLVPAPADVPPPSSNISPAPADAAPTPSDTPPLPNNASDRPPVSDAGDQTQPTEYKIQWGDTLSGIAFSVLHGIGMHTSFSTLRSMIRYIAAYNHIANPNKIYAGHTLRLPPGFPMPAGATGHDHVPVRHRIQYHEARRNTEHHSAEREIHEHTVPGNKKSSDDNGVSGETKRELPPVPALRDKSKPEKKQPVKPSPEPHNDSPDKQPKHDTPVKPEDHDKPPEKSPELDPLANPEVQQEHARVIEMAKHHNNAHEYHQFVHDINQFEHSFGKLEESYRVKGMNQEEIVKEIAGKIVRSYKGVEKIYKTKARDSEDRSQLDLTARTGVHNVATAPVDGNIAQGYHHNTCTVTAVETKLCIEHPDKYMNMVADLAVAGQYTAIDDKGISRTVKIDNTPYGSSTLSIQGQNGKRNYASQLAQVAMINLDLQEKDPHLSWVQQKPDLFNHSSGEALLRDGKIIDHQPEFGANDIARMYSLVSGEPLKPIEIEYKTACESDAICVASRQGFEKVLQERKDKGEFWTVVAVQTASKLLNQPNPAGHALLISGYYPGDKNNPAEVRYFNWWGKKYANKVAYTATMFDSLLKPSPKQ